MLNQLETRQKLLEQIFQTQNGKSFNDIALEIFQYQATYNHVYQKFLAVMKIKPENINSVAEIPFLPIEIFKYENVVSLKNEPELFFKSSGTSGERSTHYIFDLKIYEESIINCFKIFYGDPSDYVFLALLPNYLEQENSSLVYMVNKLMEFSGREKKGFYLNNFEELFNEINYNLKSDKKLFLIGVSYALLDFSEKHSLILKNSVVMETGGMKGRKEEIVREELHKKLINAFGVSQIHSEYSMTELMSQAYSKQNGLFKTPPWMKIIIRDIQDPKTILDKNLSGGINIIDLANIDSCSFIATQDIGTKYSDESFEVIGRIDNSDIRGCSLLFN